MAPALKLGEAPCFDAYDDDLDILVDVRGDSRLPGSPS